MIEERTTAPSGATSMRFQKIRLVQDESYRVNTIAVARGNEKRDGMPIAKLKDDPMGSGTLSGR